MFKLLRYVVFVLGICISVANAEKVTLTNSVYCYDSTFLHDALAKKYNEAVVITGVLATGKKLMVLYTNKNTTSWSLVIVDTTKQSCIWMHGDGLSPYVPNRS